MVQNLTIKSVDGVLGIRNQNHEIGGLIHWAIAAPNLVCVYFEPKNTAYLSAEMRLIEMNRMATIDKVFILICFLSPKIPGQLDTIERGVNKFILTSVPGRPYASWANRLINLMGGGEDWFFCLELNAYGELVTEISRKSEPSSYSTKELHDYKTSFLL